MPNPVPSESGIVVGRIVDRPEIELVAQRTGLGSPQTEDGVPMTGSHRGEAACAGTSQQREHDGLGLIVEGVTGHRLESEDLDAGLTRSFFQVRPVGEVHPLDPAPHPEPLGDVRRGLGVAIGIRPQPVVHVNGVDAQPVVDRQRSEGGRVGPTREGDGGRRTDGGEGAAVEQTLDEGAVVRRSVQRSSRLRCLPAGYLCDDTLFT